VKEPRGTGNVFPTYLVLYSVNVTTSRHYSSTLFRHELSPGFQALHQQIAHSKPFPKLEMSSGHV